MKKRGPCVETYWSPRGADLCVRVVERECCKDWEYHFLISTYEFVSGNVDVECKLFVRYVSGGS